MIKGVASAWNISNLSEHIEVSHLRVVLYKCQQCDKKFVIRNAFSKYARLLGCNTAMLLDNYWTALIKSENKLGRVRVIFMDPFYTNWCVSFFACLVKKNNKKIKLCI